MLKNKNILFLTHSYADFDKNQIELIAKHFNKVYVLVRYKPIAEISNYITYNAAQNHTYKNQIVSADKPENVIVIPVPLWYLPFDIFYKYLGNCHLRVVKKLIKKHNIKFDIIHAHFTWTAGYVGAKLKDIYNLPYVLTVHEHLSIYNEVKKSALNDNLNQSNFKNHSNERIYEFKQDRLNVMNKANDVIFVNQKNYNIGIRTLRKQNVFLINNGFLTKLFFYKNKFECRKVLKLDLNRKIILNIASLDKVKGHEYLFNAIHSLIKIRTDVLCLIIGNGPLYKTLQKQINTLGLQNHVQLIGRVQHNFLVNWLNASDLFILPSISESFGIVQIEAMACGKPVVATRNGGSEEVITNDEVGFLCENANAGDMAKKIELALNKKWDKDKIIRHAQKFTWENAVEKILSIYSNHFK